MPSYRQKQAGYILPTPIDGYPLLDVCLKIPDTREYRAAFHGLVMSLGKTWMWEKRPGETDEQIRVAQLWNYLLATYLRYGEECATGDCEDDMACCDDQTPILAQIAQTLENINNTLAAQKPCGCEDAPPIETDPEQEIDDARCQIAAGVAYQIIQRSTDPLNFFIAEYPGNPGMTFTDFINSFTTPFRSYAPMVEFWDTLFHAGMSPVDYALDIITQLGNSGYQGEVQCKLFCIMPNPPAMNDQIRYQWSMSILTPDLLDATNNYLAAFINGLDLEYLQEQAALASVTPTEFDCTACPCFGDNICEQEVLDLTISDGGFQPVLSGTGVLRGQYVLGQGWLSVEDPTVQRLNLARRINPADILNIRLFYNEAIASTINRSVVIRNTSTGQSLSQSAMAITDLGDNNRMVQATFNPVSGDIIADYIEITLVSAAAEPTNRITLYRVEVDCE